MAHGRAKYQSQDSRNKVHEILLRHWDPIGVQDVPEAQDEYDIYVRKVDVMLMDDQSSEQVIAAYLYDSATNHMGYRPFQS